MEVSVVGAGTMGNGIAHVFAQAGRDVRLIDVSPDALERALATIKKNMDRQVAKEKISEEERDRALGKISTATDLSAVAGSDLVVEAAIETPEIKFDIFRRLDQESQKDTILAT
ncbi:MAG: 3-hydroxyacyl-CoA dehydrogenase NAD-binding domain-containing protein, partial [Gemmatimonadota bacterium]|nr:3-hydroxyacyl-CoA dehydrogenase NAD-binding domain-containing protein [Gemmatimonadota bacterium]